MTKKDIIDAMKDLSDDAQVYVYCTSLDSDGGHYAEDLYFDDIIKGDNVQNEITLIAHIS